jgi:hypothetical protein
VHHLNPVARLQLLVQGPRLVFLGRHGIPPIGVAVILGVPADGLKPAKARDGFAGALMRIAGCDPWPVA